MNERPTLFQWDGEATSLRARLAYDLKAGIFTWQAKPSGTKDAARWNSRYAGKPAGSPNRDGYINIKIDGRLHPAHRLAWLYVHGHWPVLEIDHRNGIRADNRLQNLREATRTEQMHNLRRPTTNTSGFKGVSLYQGKRWRAYIHLNGKPKHLGYFLTAELAHAAYCKAALAARGEFARLS